MWQVESVEEAADVKVNDEELSTDDASDGRLPYTYLTVDHNRYDQLLIIIVGIVQHPVQ